MFYHILDSYSAPTLHMLTFYYCDMGTVVISKFLYNIVISSFLSMLQLSRIRKATYFQKTILNFLRHYTFNGKMIQ